jgi:hypothetical protein
VSDCPRSANIRKFFFLNVRHVGCCKASSRAVPETTLFLSRSVLPRCPTPPCLPFYDLPSYSFRYFVLYLNTTLLCPFEMIIDVQERRVAACFPQRCVLVPEVRPTRHSKDTRISRIRRLLATPSTSYLHNPPLCHTNTRTHLRAHTMSCNVSAVRALSQIDPDITY